LMQYHSRGGELRPWLLRPFWRSINVHSSRRQLINWIQC